MSATAEPTRDRLPAKPPVTLDLPRPWPAKAVLAGRYARLEPLDAEKHAASLYRLGHDGTDAARASWDYLPYGPFASEADLTQWIVAQTKGTDPHFYAIVDPASGEAKGWGTLMTIVPDHATIEIGHLWFSPAMQRTPMATEALFLLLRHALDDLGYRRMEWKCDANNAPSRAAAVRLGYLYEGTFFNHRVVKGQNRDTAWFSILDEEWPELRAAFETWLSPDNFDANGIQRQSLSVLTRR
ncbi:MAG: GNAT family N-acetyltransferase [Thermomicrobiales bacterium]